jgi:hypothetical protein
MAMRIRCQVTSRKSGSLANQTCLDDTSPPGLSKGYVNIKKRRKKTKEEKSNKKNEYSILPPGNAERRNYVYEREW